MEGNPQFHGFNWCQTRLYIVFIAHDISGVYGNGNSVYFSEKFRKKFLELRRCELTVFIHILALFRVCIFY